MTVSTCSAGCDGGDGRGNVSCEDEGSMRLCSTWLQGELDGGEE